MSFTGAITSVLKQNYANFQGRAMRSEYWYFQLFYIIAFVAVAIIAVILAAIFGKIIIYLIFGIFLIAFLVPALAVSTRRLHDLNKSGFWLFMYGGPWLASLVLSHLSLILGGLCSLGSLIGAVVLLVWFCMPGTRGPNRFGGGTGNMFTSTGPMPMPVGFN